MINLLKMEFIKVRKTKYFIGSFLSMLLTPLVAFFWMTLNPQGFHIGDYNRFNIFVLCFIITRTVFPIISMSLLKTGNGINGIKSAFLSPNNRKTLLLSKVIFGVVWMFLLVCFSVLLVLVTEFYLFRDLAVMGILFKTLPQYGAIMLYAFPFQMIGMFLALILNNLVIPTLLFVVTTVTGYVAVLMSEQKLLNTVIPASLYSNTPLSLHGWFIFVMLWVMAVMAYFVLDHMIRTKEYIE